MLGLMNTYRDRAPSYPWRKKFKPEESKLLNGDWGVSSNENSIDSQDKNDSGG